MINNSGVQFKKRADFYLIKKAQRFMVPAKRNRKAYVRCTSQPKSRTRTLCRVKRAIYGWALINGQFFVLITHRLAQVGSGLKLF